jgi:hypothetical protein
MLLGSKAVVLGRPAAARTLCNFVFLAVMEVMHRRNHRQMNQKHRHYYRHHHPCAYLPLHRCSDLLFLGDLSILSCPLHRHGSERRYAQHDSSNG